MMMMMMRMTMTMTMTMMMMMMMMMTMTMTMTITMMTMMMMMMNMMMMMMMMMLMMLMMLMMMLIMMYSWTLSIHLSFLPQPHTPNTKKGPTSTETFMCFQQISPTVTHQSHWLPCQLLEADWGNADPWKTPLISLHLRFQYNTEYVLQYENKNWRTISDLEVGRWLFLLLFFCVRGTCCKQTSGHSFLFRFFSLQSWFSLLHELTLIVKRSGNENMLEILSWTFLLHNLQNRPHNIFEKKTLEQQWICSNTPI